MIGKANKPLALRAEERAAQSRRLAHLLPAGAALLSSYSTLLVVVIMFCFFGLTSARFFSLENVSNILQQMSIVGVLSIGMTMVILLGGVDLSVGSVVLLSSAITGTLIDNYHVPTALSILAGLLAGGLVGLLNGLLIEKLQISPIIVTLGTMIGVRGAGQVVLWINNSWVWITDPFLVSLAGQRWLFLPVNALLMFVLYALAAILLKQTAFGRYLYAIGGNERAARLCGLPVTRVRVLAYVLSGVGAGIAGMLTAAHTGVVNPTLGNGLEFNAITAVVLGGASLSGGVGRVEKTLLGVAILVMLLNYLTLRGVPDIWQTTVTGALILAAVLLDRLLRFSREEH
jgi:ribose transport system permease protein